MGVETGKPVAGNPIHSGRGLCLRDRWLIATFLLFLFCLCAAAIIILFHDGNERVLPIALLSGILIWALEHLELRYAGGPAAAWNALSGYVTPVAIIALAVFAVCLPTRKIYFVSDDFAYIHLFQNVSLSRFFGLFHSDLSQGIWGTNIQELRPLYGLSYMLSYSFWGLHLLGYHLTSILIHILNSVMVFLIAKSLGPNGSWRAAFAGLLFAVQPTHSVAISWINGSLTEGPPTFFYLAAFLFFVWFRGTGLNRYIVWSLAAFAAALLSKETAVTLPLMLVAYDCFRKEMGQVEAPAGVGAAQPGQRRLLTYVPYAALLLVYLALREWAFGSLLREDQINSGLSDLLSGPAGFWHRITLLGWEAGRKVSSVQYYNLRRLLLSFPAAILGCVLGLYSVWVLSIFRRRSASRRSIAIVLYFGMVWYLISNVPLLAVYIAPHHLSLPAVGPCIAMAFLAFPHSETGKEAGYFRLLGSGFLVCVSAAQLWQGNAEFAQQGANSEREATQLAAALEATPKPALAVIGTAGGFRWMEDSWPFAVQPPFRSTDLYSQARVIEPPDMYCCPLSQWWEKTRLALDTELAGPSEERIEVRLLLWDVPSDSLRMSRRVVARGLLQARVTQSLGSPIGAVNKIQRDSADRLVRDLAKMVSDGG